jgi:hypothetical protein
MLSGLQEHIAVRWQKTESAITGEHIYEIAEKIVENSVSMPILFYLKLNWLEIWSNLSCITQQKPKMPATTSGHSV